MTQVSQSRSRRTATVGLVLQLLAFGTFFYVHTLSGSWATLALAWYTLVGALVWFVSLLVFRQRELAELEDIDLEQLRREKAAGTSSETIFDEEAGGFRVAQSRLEWMQKWVVPTFSLLTGLGLVAAAVFFIYKMRVVPDVSEVSPLKLGTSEDALDAWARQLKDGVRVPFVKEAAAMIILGISVLCTFLFSRYAAGMARVKEWQMLRGCGSFLFGNAIVTIAIIVSLGFWVYGGNAYIEHVLAYVIPCVMILLGVETLLNFLLDIYRPRVPGVEPRAAFDSRLLGLFAEPGGIAHSIAEAVNYQFGFEVSQTWFYQLLQRIALPLAAVGAVVLMALTSVVVVQPHERVLIERFGSLQNEAEPMQPGIHIKWPWPIECARVFNTEKISQIYVGFDKIDGDPENLPEDEKKNLTSVLQWTDEKHLGLDHYDFLTPVDARTAEIAARAESDAVSVNSIRMVVAIQYRIDEANLATYCKQIADPVAALRNIAWHTTTQFVSTHDVESLISQRMSGDVAAQVEMELQIGQALQREIQEVVTSNNLGLDVVYVGLQNVHPEKTVAEAYREVVNAESEKYAKIRRARVEENELLSEIAGTKPLARRLSRAINQRRPLSEKILRLEETILDVDPESTASAVGLLNTEDIRQAYQAYEQASLQAELDAERYEDAYQAYLIGLDYTKNQIAQIAQERDESREKQLEAKEAIDVLVTPIRDKVSKTLSREVADALVSRVALEQKEAFWSGQLDDALDHLQGRAAQVLALGLGQRWQEELSAASQVTRVQTEAQAFQAAPEIYKTRAYLEALVNGMRNTRKYFLAFDPEGRTVRVRYKTGVDSQNSLKTVDLTELDQ